MLSLLLLTTLAQAQVNTEQYRPEDDGWSGGLDLKLSLQSGNVDLVDAGLGGSVGWHGDADTIYLVTAGRFATKRTQADYEDAPTVLLFDEESRYANQLLAHARLVHTLTERVAAEVFSQLETNQFLRLNRRELGGAGLRFALAEGEAGALHVGTGLMLEDERLDPSVLAPTEPADTLALRSTSYLTGEVQADDAVRFALTLYAQPRLSQLGDYRLLAEGSVSFAIREWLGFGLEGKLRHDSQPPTLADDQPALRPTDITVSNKLSMSF